MLATDCWVFHTSRVRFLPATDYDGSVGALTVRAVDNTYTGQFSTTHSGETRNTLNTSPSQPSAISGSTSPLQTSITNVNHVPTLDNYGNSIIAGRTVSAPTALFNTLSNDADGDSLTAGLGLRR